MSKFFTPSHIVGVAKHIINNPGKAIASTIHNPADKLLGDNIRRSSVYKNIVRPLTKAAVGGVEGYLLGGPVGAAVGATTGAFSGGFNSPFQPMKNIIWPGAASAAIPFLSGVAGSGGFPSVAGYLSPEGAPLSGPLVNAGNAVGSFNPFGSLFGKSPLNPSSGSIGNIFTGGIAGGNNPLSLGKGLLGDLFSSSLFKNIGAPLIGAGAAAKFAPKPPSYTPVTTAQLDAATLPQMRHDIQQRIAELNSRISAQGGLSSADTMELAQLRAELARQLSQQHAANAISANQSVNNAKGQNYQGKRNRFQDILTGGMIGFDWTHPMGV